MAVQAVASRERRISEAASLARLSEVASLYIPLAPPSSIPCVRCAPSPHPLWWAALLPAYLNA